MDHYHYKCSDCESHFSIEDIEKTNQYLCPNCGEMEKERPLKGVLLIEYDYSEIKRKLSREDFLRLIPGEFWGYPELWPLVFEEKSTSTVLEKISNELLNKLRLPANPLLKYFGKKQRFSIFDDTRNPTLSFKDRASILVVLKGLQMGIHEIAAASTGNAASSLAGICARAGLTAHLFVPENIPVGKRIQIQSFGGQIYLVKGDYDQAFDLSMEISTNKGWYNRNTALNPLTIEGKKWAAYDIFLAAGGKMPSSIFVPVGDGVVISGIYKGLWELMQLGWIEEMPRLIAVQSSGSNALVRFMNTGKFEYQAAHTIADSIHAGAPRNLYLAANAVQESDGLAVEVSDEPIIDAQKIICGEMGILVEPAAAASFAGYQKAIESAEIDPGENPLLMFTGNGLKDVKALENWNPQPTALSADEWLEKFEIA